MTQKISFILISLLLFTANFSQAVLNNNELEKSIEKNRKGKIIVTGKPGAVVKIHQQKHEFWFGCAVASQVFQENSRMPEKDKNTYKEKFLENFNSAVTENSVKWASMERQRGIIDYKTTENISDWAAENSMPIRGHNLYWGIEKFVQDWVKDLNDDELRKALEKRGTETAKHFKGRFTEYDLNNEMIHGNYYEKRLGEGITKDMANWVLAGDNHAKLWLNDYDILTGNRLEDYLAQIRKLKKQGVPIAGIGVQGHLHGGTFLREKLIETLDSLNQFGLPIKITEFNLPGQRSKFYLNRAVEITMGEELLKAKDIVDYYTICFASPAVEGILMWGFWGGANWIPQSSLYNRDWSPTPALEAYQNLIYKEWWTTESVTLDENGKAEISAFFGDYKIESGETVRTISHKKEKGNTKLKLD